VTTTMADRWREHLRISVLRVLEQAPGYAANDSILLDVLRSELGFGASRDQVRSEIAWLSEQGLVRAETFGAGGLTVATLTGRGQDVAAGIVTHPGVKRPSARS
jgi:Fe2+ or Zn2+ uptake regulation protein